jgi:hypothetical protein
MAVNPNDKVFVVNENINTKYGGVDPTGEFKTVSDLKGYKVYTALLTQSGEDDPDQEVDGDQTITKGITYEIINVSAGDDLTTIGAPNNNLGTKFVATRDAVGEFNGATILYYNTGAPVVTVLENTIGNIWFTYQGVGTYNAKSNGLFPFDKTVTFMGISVLSNIMQSCWNDEDPDNGIFIGSYSQSSYLANSRVNNLLYNTPIEIRVYN